MKNYIVKNNKGLTLLEMIISVAILSIVIVTIMSFMVTGTKMFGASNNEIKLQQEAQMALSNVENRIIDTKRGVRCDDDGTQVILTVFNEKTGADAKEYIVWNRNDKKIYYASSAFDVTLNTFPTNEVLASNVENFNVVMRNTASAVTVTPNPSVTVQPSGSALKQQSKVEITIEVKEKGRTFTSQKVVTFRNNIVLGASGDTIFTGTRNGLDSKAQDVKVTPEDVYLVPGESYQFNARVTGVGYPSQVVNWSANDAGVTIDNSGRVTVDRNTVAGGVVQIVATAPENSDGTIPSGTARLHISKINGINVTTNTQKVFAGSMLKVNVEVVGNELNDEMKKVTFSLEDENGATPSWVRLYSSSGVFGLDKEARGKTFTIVATSTHNPEISGKLKIKVENTALSDIGSQTVQVNRNSSTELVTNVTGENLAASELQIQWSIADDAGLGNKVSIGTYNGVLNVSKDINYENEYQLKVAATISAIASDRLSEPVTTYITVTIPKVSIHFVNGDGGAEIQKNGTVVLPYEVIGLDGAAPDIDATTNPSIRNSIIYVTNESVKLSIGADVKSSKISVIATVKNTNASDSMNVTVK